MGSIPSVTMFIQTFRLCSIITSLSSLFPFGDADFQSCYSSNPNPYRRMGQKSSYFINANEDASEIEYPGCEPVLLWYLGRHGARKPSDKEILEMAVKLPELQDRIVQASAHGDMCQEDVKLLEEWRFNYTEGEDHKL